MGIVFPNEAIARRWNGALQARLRRAPLEAFLRARSLVPAPAGVAQDNDNLVRGTVLIVEGGLALYLAERAEELGYAQQALVGHVACLVSRALAGVISRPTAWRTVALVSTARLLTPWIGLSAAAISAAATTRQFQKESTETLMPLDGLITEAACGAINRGSAEAMAEVSTSICVRLNSGGAAECACALRDLKKLSAGL